MKMTTLRLFLMSIVSGTVLSSCQLPPKNENNIPWNSQSDQFEGARYNNFPGTR
jgi:hypothetical protein